MSRKGLSYRKKDTNTVSQSGSTAPRSLDAIAEVAESVEDENEDDTPVILGSKRPSVLPGAAGATKRQRSSASSSYNRSTDAAEQDPAPVTAATNPGTMGNLNPAAFVSNQHPAEEANRVADTPTPRRSRRQAGKNVTDGSLASTAGTTSAPSAVISKPSARATSTAQRSLSVNPEPARTGTSTRQSSSRRAATAEAEVNPKRNAHDSQARPRLPTLEELLAEQSPARELPADVRAQIDEIVARRRAASSRAEDAGLLAPTQHGTGREESATSGSDSAPDQDEVFDLNADSDSSESDLDSSASSSDSEPVPARGRRKVAKGKDQAQRAASAPAVALPARGPAAPPSERPADAHTEFYAVINKKKFAVSKAISFADFSTALATASNITTGAWKYRVGVRGTDYDLGSESQFGQLLGAVEAKFGKMPKSKKEVVEVHLRCPELDALAAAAKGKNGKKAQSDVVAGTSGHDQVTEELIKHLKTSYKCPLNHEHCKPNSQGKCEELTLGMIQEWAYGVWMKIRGVTFDHPPTEADHWAPWRPVGSSAALTSGLPDGTRAPRGANRATVDLALTAMTNFMQAQSRAPSVQPELPEPRTAARQSRVVDMDLEYPLLLPLLEQMTQDEVARMGDDARIYTLYSAFFRVAGYRDVSDVFDGRRSFEEWRGRIREDAQEQDVRPVPSQILQKIWDRCERDVMRMNQ
ncbi:hypothetical protein EXIGLDRAFT_763996 [Exidia glandulosa HHB12029]|uniref:Uncharacterized protein n=1 Tax=Exidia glandulosa HHB12029 TaxID=1314781 RepID=A0A165LK50_EXIGL|nr:hypothetical protein EXIGLDRAFT_763996 [Exidia glandulosa HHB12029]